jgi:prepilin-type N-terminal cleavage/methylation domain-containing protein
MRTLERRRSQGGFTLLELVIVLAILAAIAGVVVTQYDGLIDKAGVTTSTYNDSALDSAIRTYRVINSSFPDSMDSLLVDGPGTGSAASDFYAGLSQELTLNGVDLGNGSTAPKLQRVQLTANQLAALNNVGIANLQYIAPTFNQVGSIPNADFLSMDPNNAPSSSTGYLGTRGVSRQLQAGTSYVCAVNPVYLRNVCGYSGRSTSGDVVVAFGVGSSATIVKNGLADAPYYAKAAPNEYGRFLAMFLVTRDVQGTGVAANKAPNPQAIPPSGASATGSLPTGAQTYANFYADLPKAVFLGVLDGHGDGQDEEYAESTGQKAN